MLVTLVVLVVLVVIFLKKHNLLQLLHIQCKLVLAVLLILKVVLQSLTHKLQ
jgi:hypothetical protein